MPNIEYRFVEAGKESVKGAFREIGQEARSSKRDVDAALKSFEQLGRTRASPAARARAAGDGSTIAEGQRREAIAKRAFADRKHYQERLGQEVAQAQQRREQEAARTQQRREKDTHRVAQALGRDRAAEDRKQAALRRTLATEEATKKADIHRATMGRIRQQGQAEKGYWSERRRQHQETAQAEDRAARNAKELARERKRINDKSIFTGGIGGQLKGAAIGASLAAGAAGAGIVGVAARDALRVRELANRVSINSRLAGQAAIDPAVLQKEFEQTAIRTPGQTAVGVGEALQGFVAKTGRADVGRQSLGTFATVASATGSDIRDVSNAAADLFQKFDVTSIEDMRDALAALTFQGKEGAFELKDAAAQFSKLSAAASRFGIDKGVSGVKTLGGLTQIARSATGSPEQAATAVEATLRQLIAQSGAIKGLGVDVFQKGSKSKTRDVRDVLVETIAGAKGQLPKLQKIFGEEGIRGVSPLISTFNQASNTTVGNEAQKTAAGIAAMREQLAKAIDAPGDWAEVQKDAAQAQQDASAKLSAAWENLQSKVGAAVIPILSKLADSLADSPGAIEAFVGTIEVLAEAMMGWLQIIEDIIGVEKKRLPPEKLEQQKREEAARLVKQVAEKEKQAGGTEEDVAKLRKQGKIKEAQALQEKLSAPELVTLRERRDAAKREVGAAQAETNRVVDIQQNIRSKEQFMAEYKALATPGQPVRMLGGGKAGGITTATAIEENAAQKEFRLAQEQAKTEEKTRLGVGEGRPDVELAMKNMGAFAAAAAQAAEAMKKISAQGQPSAVGT